MKIGVIYIFLYGEKNYLMIKEWGWFVWFLLKNVLLFN